MFEWETHADGMIIIEPGGKVTTMPHSHRMMWPPATGSNLPRAVIEQQPNVRLLKSMCQKQAVLGPKLTVAVAQGLSGKFGYKSG